MCAPRCGVMRGQMRAQRRAGEQHRRAGIRQHERQPLGRIVRVERQIGAAGLEDAEQPHQHRQRALDAQPHHHLGPDPERAQVMRQLARARIELAVAQPLVLEHHRDRLRRARHLRREQLRQGRGRDRTRGGVPLPQDGVTLLSAQNVEPADRTLRVGNRSLQQPHQPARNRLHARAIEQVAGIFQRPLDPRRTAVRTRRSARLSDRSNFALAVATASNRASDPASSSSSSALFCNTSITWNSG